MDKDIIKYLHYYLAKARVRHRFSDVEKVLSPLWWMAVGAGIVELIKWIV